MSKRSRFSRADLESARDKFLPDVIGPGLNLLFVGINPGLYTAAAGHHFARPGNRFWPAIYEAGFTPRLFSPEEDQQLLELGYGLTNVVERATATADELTNLEIVEGGKHLVEKIERYRPRVVAVLGVGAYRTAFGRPKAKMGPQPDMLGGAVTWVLPNPSGLNAHYRLHELSQVFRELREAVEQGD